MVLPCLAALAVVGSAAVASADERPSQQSGLPQPTPPGTPGSTTVVAPPGSGGVTVVAPTPGGGQVTASGCSTVVVAGQPTLVTPTGAPCPQLAPYQPYYGPPPQQQYYAPPPRYARDPERTAALIASAVGFGVGGAVSGIYYLVQYTRESNYCGDLKYDYQTRTYHEDNSACGSSRGSLITYGAIVSLVPSIPRFVVGDATRGLIYSGLRAVSVTTAALINWGDNDDTQWQGPFLLGFVAPITLGIIDLATTPHREDLEAKTAKSGIQQIAPVAVTDRNGRPHGGVLSIGGIF